MRKIKFLSSLTLMHYLQKIDFQSLYFGLFLIYESIIEYDWLYILIAIVFSIINFALGLDFFSKFKHPFYHLPFDLIFLAFNMSFFIITFNFEMSKEQTLMSGIKITIIELSFLSMFKFSLVKCLSLLINSLYFILNSENLKIEDLVFLIVLNIFFYFYCFLLHFKKNTKQKKNSSIYKEKYSLNLADIEMNDYLFILDDKKNIIYCNQLLKALIKDKGIEIKEILKKLEKSNFTLKQEFDLENCSQAFFDAFIKNKKTNKIQPENDLISKTMLFSQFLKNLITENKIIKFPIIYFGSICIQNDFFIDENNSLLIIREKEQIIIKLKTDLFIKECYNLQIKLENQSKAIAFVAHEFRTPLNCIVNLLQSLDTIVKIKQSKEYVTPSLISSRFLLNLVNDLLDVAQIQEDKLRLNIVEFDLRLLMSDTIQIISIQAESRGLKLELDIDKKIPKSIYSDPNRLRQIITNLLANAIKYTTKGIITLQARKSELNSIKISVIDTGLGIKPEELNNLFKAFGKINEKQDQTLNPYGVGLGLVISNKIAFLLNDCKDSTGIQVDSVYGEGSVFSFKIIDCSEGWIINETINSDDFLDNKLLGLFETKFINNIDKEEFKALSEGAKNGTLSHLEINAICNSPGINSSKDMMMQSRKSDNICLKSENFGFRVKPNNKKRSVSTNKSRTNTFFIGDASSLQSISRKGFFNDEFSISKETDKISNFFNINKCQCSVALVVDDNDFNILAIMTHFKKLEIKADCSISGDDAIEKIKNRYHHSNCCKFYDVILLDIEMPFKDGFETYKEIKNFYDENNSVINHIIAVTAHIEGTEIIERIKNCGITDILYKPLSIQSLIIALEKNTLM